MLLDWDLAELGKVASVPCQVCMGIAKPRHEGAAAPVEHPYGGVIHQPVDVGYSPYSGDSLA